MAELTMEFTGRIQDLNDCIFALFEADALGAATQKEIPGGGTLTMRPMMVRKAYGIPQYIEIILSIGSSIAAGLASNYIYDRVTKHKIENLTMRINRRGVSINRLKIATMINAEIENKSVSK
jgi:hypothetical protein